MSSDTGKTVDRDEYESAYHLKYAYRGKYIWNRCLISS